MFRFRFIVVVSFIFCQKTHYLHEILAIPFAILIHFAYLT